MLLAISIVGCGGDSDTEDAPESACVTSQLENDMTTTLSQLNTDVDFSFSIVRDDAHQYTYNRGSSSMNTSYESASTAKLVTAVVIMRLVEQHADFNLTDHPQDWIPSWPITSNDSLYGITLEQLLSFTSGLENDHLCLSLGISNFETCINNLATENAGNGITPGTEFYYGPTHLQVAGLMAMKAGGFATWQALFNNFKSETGLFPTSIYDYPSTTNPRLAAGMHWTANEYLDFLKALKNGDLLNESSMALLLTDHTASATIVNSPALDGLNEDWHYGFGLWHECQSNSYNCQPGSRISSPGAYGAYPFWDRTSNHVGIVARQGGLLTYTKGIEIERNIHSMIESWASCQQ